MRLLSHWVLEARVNSLTAMTLPHAEHGSLVIRPGLELVWIWEPVSAPFIGVVNRQGVTFKVEQCHNEAVGSGMPRHRHCKQKLRMSRQLIYRCHQLLPH